jgi:hypothetical protein
MQIDGYDCGANSGINEWQGKQEYSEKICPSVALPTLDHTWLDLESNQSSKVGSLRLARLLVSINWKGFRRKAIRLPVGYFAQSV